MTIEAVGKAAVGLVVYKDAGSNTVTVTRDMWETLLDALERRYRRREGVSDQDIADVKKVLGALPEEGERPV